MNIGKNTVMSRVLSFVTVLAMVGSILTPLSAVAQNPNQVVTINIDQINDSVPGDACFVGAVTLEGSGELTKAPGQIDQYRVKIDWGDGNIESGIPIVTTGIDKDSYTYTFTATHNTFSATSISITAYIYHVNPQGQDGASEAQDIVSVCVAPPTTGVLNVKKLVTNENGGTAVPGDFTLHVKNSSDTDVSGSPFFGSDTTGEDFILDPGVYTVSENTVAGYSGVITGCATDGTITIEAGGNYSCTITNTDIPLPPADTDDDGIPDDSDNCPSTYNPGQEDIDGDNIGDVCDTESDVNSCNDTLDNDGDTFVDLADSGCSAFIPTLTVEKTVVGGTAIAGDFNFFADAIQVILGVATQLVADTYTITETGPDYYDATFSASCTGGLVMLAYNDHIVCQITNTFQDSDGDTVANPIDNCPNVANTDQADQDGDGIGDVCDDDIDGDTVVNNDDNCVYTPNTDQADLDEDGIGDACEGDVDGDDVLDGDDNCPLTFNPNQEDTDDDGIGDVCDDDIDGDEVLNDSDNCVYTPNTDQADQDGDSVGDVCDPDTDGDGVGNDTDNCELTPNTDQLDTDEDGIGDVCDDDIDGDEVLNDDDNCPLTFNPNQEDTDDDGIGDVCDDTPDGGDVCPNLTGIQETIPENHYSVGGQCVLDTTDPVSAFDNARNHQILETELTSLSLTGSSTDDLSGVASANISIYSIPGVLGENGLDGEVWEGLSCTSIPENATLVGSTVALTLDTPGGLSETWSYDWANPAKGVYCAVVHATDVAGNVENTAIAGPFAYTYTAPVTPPTPPTPPSGGGGGGIGGFPINNNPSSGGQVLGASTQGMVLGVSAEMCEQYLTSYIRSGANNNSEQVLRLQRFLRDLEGFSSVSETGVYDQASLNAVHQFQLRYSGDVLAPWGATRSTGYVYYTTRKKVNEVYCKFARNFPLTEDQLSEIERVRNLGEAVFPKTTVTPSVTAPTEPAPSTDDTSEEVGSAVQSSQTAAVVDAVPQEKETNFFKRLWNKLFGN